MLIWGSQKLVSGGLRESFSGRLPRAGLRDTPGAVSGSLEANLGSRQLVPGVPSNIDLRYSLRVSLRGPWESVSGSPRVSLRGSRESVSGTPDSQYQGASLQLVSGVRPSVGFGSALEFAFPEGGMFLSKVGTFDGGHLVSER